MYSFIKELSEIAAVQVSEPMANHTTLRIGGPADIYTSVSNAPVLCLAVRLAKQYEIPFFVLGAGSNILVRDGGIRGVVIENKARHLKELEPPSAEEEIIWRAESGMPLATLARRSVKQGLSGLEWAVGIPGTIGGAVVSNAGAYGGDVSQVVRSVQIVNSHGNIRQLGTQDLAFGYRESVFSGEARNGNLGTAILIADIVLKPAAAPDLQSKVKEMAVLRKQSQPRRPSAGSIFKNPPGFSAGHLIESVGLKGHRLGDAMFSLEHANFIVNLGAATASEVESLIRLARGEVRSKFGIDLELEIGIVGEEA